MPSRRAAALGLLLGLCGAVVPSPLLTSASAGASAQRTWHGDQARIPAAQAPGRHGAGVVVAVLDSWVDRGHPDFEGRALRGADCTGGSCREGQSSDPCDHGTHVAGTVASSSYGVARRATVLPVRVLSHDEASGDCIGRPADVVAGIRWAVARGADVINLSLGPDAPGLSSASTTIAAAVREAADADVVVVFSAGNTGAPVTDAYGDTALIVAATGPNGSLASYSQRGDGVDLAAPGGDPANKDACRVADCVTSLFPGGRYAVSAGTSMAAPHVAGVAALLLAQQPSRTRQQVASRLTSTARPLAQAGAGLLDATRALGATAPPSSAAPKPPRTSSSPRAIVRGSTRPARPRPAAPPATAPAPPRPSSVPSRAAVVPPTAPPTSLPPSATPPADGGVLVAEPARLPGAEVPTSLALLAAGLVGSSAVGVALTALAGRRRTLPPV